MKLYEYMPIDKLVGELEIRDQQIEQLEKEAEEKQHTIAHLGFDIDQLQEELGKYKPNSSIKELLEHTLIKELTIEQINSCFHMFNNKNTQCEKDKQELIGSLKISTELLFDKTENTIKLEKDNQELIEYVSESSEILTEELGAGYSTVEWADVLLEKNSLKD